MREDSYQCLCVGNTEGLASCCTRIIKVFLGSWEAKTLARVIIMKKDLVKVVLGHIAIEVEGVKVVKTWNSQKESERTGGGSGHMSYN